MNTSAPYAAWSLGYERRRDCLLGLCGPVRNTGGLNVTRPTSIDSPIMRRIVAAIATAPGPVDCYWIAAHAFVGRRTFLCNYRPVLIEAGKLHIAEYRRVAIGPFRAFYLPGPAPEGFVAHRPKNKPQVEAQREWRERTAYFEKVKAERRLKRPPDPAMAALLGLTARYHKSPRAHNQEKQA